MQNSLSALISKRNAGSFLIAAGGAAALLSVALLLEMHRANSLHIFFLYQLCALGIMLLTILAMRWLVGVPFRHLRLGNPAAPARANRIMMVKEGESWRKIGLTFCAITLAVLLGWLIGFAWPEGDIALRGWLLAFLIALPLSASNALVEEIVTRWVLVEGMEDAAQPLAPLVSALVFGGVHYFGVPGGWSGALLAGFLAWLLARSIQDTRGMFWAVIVHFCLDVAIFTTLLVKLFA